MNKKGITLVEIIISVGLISIVMSFLFNLLIDMQYEESHATFSKENQLNRAAMIKYIESDFMNKELQNVTKNTSGGTTELWLSFTSEAKRIIVTSNKINYNNEEVYEMKDENASYDIANISIKIEKPNPTSGYLCSKYNNPSTGVEETVCSNYQLIKIVIPVKTTEKENTIDDIELFYIGKV